MYLHIYLVFFFLFLNDVLTLLFPNLLILDIVPAVRAEDLALLHTHPLLQPHSPNPVEISLSLFHRLHYDSIGLVHS